MTHFTQTPTLVRGDTQPALSMTISDAREEADFSTITAGDVVIQIEQGGTLIVDGPCDTIKPAADNKSAIVSRAWAAGDTDIAGRCWVTAVVTPWGQTFPDDGPLRLDITRRPGDA